MKLALVLTLAFGTAINGRSATNTGDAAGSFIQNLSLDLEKTGVTRKYIIRWDGKNKSDPKGRLHLEQVRGVGVQTLDTFDLGFRPRAASTISLDLPGRNVLIVEQGSLGSPAGVTFHAFSSAGGHLYRVHLVEGEKSAPLVFTEHYSAGSPALIKFTDSGRTVRTLTTLDPVTGQRRITDYSWDGVAYRKTKSYECNGDKCPAMKD